METMGDDVGSYHFEPVHQLDGSKAKCLGSSKFRCKYLDILIAGPD